MKVGSWMVVGAAALAVACGEEGGPGGSAGEGGAAGGAPDTGGRGGAPGCPEGSHEDEGSVCASTLTIARSPIEIAPKRDHHTTFVAEAGGKAYLYVMGGGTDGNTTIFDDIQRAAIGEDGALSSFEPAGHLPEPRLGHTSVVMGRYVVVAGGLTGGGEALEMLRSTSIGTIADDGTIGEWKEGPNLPVAVMHHTCNGEGARLYCIGGRIHGNFTGDMAVAAELSDDGELGAFEPVTPLSASIGFHQAFIAGHALFIAGGLHRDSPMPDFDMLTSIRRAAIEEDGSLGPWTDEGDLPIAMNTGAAEVFLDRVYFLGGMDGDRGVTDGVFAGAIGSDGALGSVDAVEARLSTARMHVHQTPSYRHWLYSVGGRDATEASLGAVDIGTFQ